MTGGCGDPVPGYVKTATGGYRKVLGPLPPGAKVYKRQGTCVEMSATELAGLTSYETGAEEAETIFVQGTKQLL